MNIDSNLNLGEALTPPADLIPSNLLEPITNTTNEFWGIETIPANTILTNTYNNMGNYTIYQLFERIGKLTKFNQNKNKNENQNQNFSILSEHFFDWFSNKIGGGCTQERRMELIDIGIDLDGFIVLLNHLYNLLDDKQKNSFFKRQNNFENEIEKYRYLLDDIIPEYERILD